MHFDKEDAYLIAAKKTQVYTNPIICFLVSIRRLNTLSRPPMHMSPRDFVYVIFAFRNLQALRK